MAGCRTNACWEVIRSFQEVLEALDELAKKHGMLEHVMAERPDIFLLAAAVLATGSAMLARQAKEGGQQ